MTNCQPKIPDRNTDKSQLKQAGTLVKTEAAQDRAPSGAVTVSDIGSPYGTSNTHHSYESIDFGETGEELI